MRYQAGNMPRPCDIVFCFKPNQGKHIDGFAESFVQALEDQTTAERAKYPATYQPPKPEDILINDAAAQRISQTVYKWRNSLSTAEGIQLPQATTWARSKHLCPHTSNISECRSADDPAREEEQDDGYIFGCPCALPFKERKASAFMRRRIYPDCYTFYEANRACFFHMELVKTLLLHGETDTVLRACSDPAIKDEYARWHSKGECNCMPQTLGWDMVYKFALEAYLVLNIIKVFPALWEPAPRGKKRNNTPGALREADYRNTAMYQYMLGLVTMDITTPATVLPHQEFFGVPDRHFSDCFRFPADIAVKYPVFRKFVKDDKATGWAAGTGTEAKKSGYVAAYKFPYGHLPFNRFLNLEETVPHLPSSQDIAQVTLILYAKRLPTELVIPILKLADYDTPRRRLPIPHDPLHAQNRNELNKYLELCWNLLVRYNLLAQELGEEIDWKGMIFNALRRHVGRPPRWELYKIRYRRNPERNEYHFLNDKRQTTHVAYASSC
ncbi:uncharacterized protein DSM5745_03672 [Aspergillus mulundensis]|uniref:Uncharacterized protein n=1 Tax=Aspergillus mulundensis TaxID=1810919 RepID=A0A3D8SL44_9EURO|nr:hypothetical protein DSM5745_03672 [Aspergillus mulundensis]RDW87030.1 hypothetical protein DSM5745_03672 [Aspergillus mulundensis]